MATPTERNRQVVRQWEILELLGERSRSIGELAAKVGDGGVTTRTVRRDLEALETARFPLFSDKDDDGVVRWRLLSKGMTPARRAA